MAGSTLEIYLMKAMLLPAVVDLVRNGSPAVLGPPCPLKAADQVVEEFVVGVELDGDAIRSWGDDGAASDALEELALFDRTAA